MTWGVSVMRQVLNFSIQFATTSLVSSMPANVPGKIDAV